MSSVERRVTLGEKEASNSKKLTENQAENNT